MAKSVRLGRIVAAMALAQERYSSEDIRVRCKVDECRNTRDGVWVPAEVFVPNNVLYYIVGGDKR